MKTLHELRELAVDLMIDSGCDFESACGAVLEQHGPTSQEVLEMLIASPETLSRPDWRDQRIAALEFDNARLLLEASRYATLAARGAQTTSAMLLKLALNGNLR